MTYGSGGFGGGSRGGSRGGFGGGSRSGFGGGRGSFGPREMHKIKCSDCGKDSEVPFKPREGSAVYCRDCFNKRKDGGDTSAPKKKEASKPVADAEDEDAEEDLDLDDAEESEEESKDSEEI